MINFMKQKGLLILMMILTMVAITVGEEHSNQSNAISSGEHDKSGIVTRSCASCPSYDDTFDMRYWWEVTYRFELFSGSDCAMVRFHLEAWNTYGFSTIDHGGASNFDVGLQLFDATCTEVENDASGDLFYTVPPEGSGYYYLKLSGVGGTSGEFWLAYTITQDHCWNCPMHDYDLGTITSSYQLSPTFIEYSGYDPSIPNPPKPCRSWRALLNAGEEYQFTFCEGGSFWSGDAQLWLLDNDCNTVATYTNCSIGNNGEIIYTAPSTGYYYIWANQVDDLPMSGFRLAYRSLGSTYSPTPEPTIAPTATPSNIRRVPSDYLTIQEAIDAAVAGNTVLIADGTYSGTGNINLTFRGKAITVSSENGYDQCIIDCQSSGRGFIFNTGEGNSSILFDITIKNGAINEHGSGISCIGTSPRIERCLITNCAPTVNAFGGGIYIATAPASPKIVDCTIRQCRSLGGGGIYCGGGTYPLISGSTITQCTASAYGGGIDCWENSNATISNCLVSYSTASNNGGGICNFHANTTILNSEIRNNTALYAGGIYVEDHQVSIRNCLVTNNTATSTVNSGGAFYFSGATVNVSNCTMTGNYASSAPGHVLVVGSGSVSIINSIIYFNAPGTLIVGTPTITYSDVQGGYTGTGNINANPKFVAGYYLSQIGSGQSITSPCVDAGSATAASICFTVPGGTACMSDYGTRTDGVHDNGLVDMGYHYITPGITPVTYQVPSQYSTIQAAIDAASNGDTVLVADGTYTGTGNRDITFRGKAITVYSASGASACVIDCQSSGRGIIFNTGELEGSRFEGFTIKNGAVADWGVGVYCSMAYPVIANCIITNCVPTINAFGGGMYINRGGPLVTGCTIKLCSALAGGGIYCNNSSTMVLENSTITQCTATSSEGGGFNTQASSMPVIKGCVFSQNIAAGNGGAFSTFNSQPTISNTIFIGNTANYGGAAYSGGTSSTTFWNCLFRSNRANSTLNASGVMYLSGSWCSIANCTFTGNSGASNPQIINAASGTNTITNSIIYFNALGTQLSGTMTVTYSDIQGGYTGTGNINLNPQFVTSHYLSQLVAGQTLDSPCVDTGATDVTNVCLTLPDGSRSCMSDYTTRTDANLDTGVVDMGFHYMPIIVSPTTRQVPSQYATIQAAIDASIDGDTVIVAAGTYTGVGNKDLTFRGKSLTVRSENGAATCMLDCQTSGRGFLFNSGELPNSCLDGFTIKNGGLADWGDGIYCVTSFPTITNCVITNCAPIGSGFGGGMYINRCAPTISGCTIQLCSALTGGGIYCANGSYPTIENTVITQCTATSSDGGGINIASSSVPVISGCVFSQNRASGNGAGLNSSSSSPSISNSEFISNTANYGGAVFISGNQALFQNCLIRSNRALSTLNAAGACYISSATTTFVNCTFTGNSGASSPQVLNVSSSTVTINNSIIYGNSAGTAISGSTVTASYSDIQGGFSGTGNIDLNPLFVTGPLGNYYLSQTAAGQASDSPCINIGNGQATEVCYAIPGSTRCLSELSTRSDELSDEGIVDLGYHYRAIFPPTATPSPYQTETLTPTLTPTETPTLTPSETATLTPTMTITETPTQTPTITATLTETPTITPSETPAETSTLTLTPTIPPIPATSPAGSLGILIFLSLLIVAYRNRVK